MTKHLKRELSNRHIQLIAIGGAIGTGLFFGSGNTIAKAGPSILFTYMIVGFFLFLFMRAMGEMLLAKTGFNTFTEITYEYLGPFVGFVVGWSYWISWVITVMGDLTAIAQYMQYFNPNIPTWVSCFAVLLLLLALNLTSTKVFGELEFWFAIIKVVTILALIVVGIVLVVLSFKTPHGHASFSNLYVHGGMFPHGLTGFLLSFQMAVYAFIGIEFIGITAGETKDPEKTLPRAINSVPLRILIFYVGALAVIMMVVPWTQIIPENSPFVSLFALAGIPFAALVINSVVLTSAASSANSGIFTNSRILFSLGDNDQAPEMMVKLTKRGIPRNALLVTCVLISITVVLNYIIPDGEKVFIYISAITTSITIAVWILIVCAYVKYVKKDKALHKASKFKLPGGIVSAYAVIAFFIFIIVIMLFDQETLIGFILSPVWYLGVTIAYFIHKRVMQKRLKP
ncbi:amino acid permease [Staphylococcus sp. SQ8-PEA]|uniref:Amino acid permease n=1 Tax=Staphylococcus marylandisciuri TaxID=2981529 RepID=A0ABT2QNT8_9STAP|nr:amino acid permease [Staphylococcus marylandisciuri]MCU5745639.1 amino acid permease [Staphylococcus marylandisciuri]